MAVRLLSLIPDHNFTTLVEQLVLYRRRDSDHFDDILLAQKRMAAVGRAPAAPWTRARVIYSLVKKLEVLGLS